MKSNGAEISRRRKQRLYIAQDGLCAYCFERLDLTLPRVNPRFASEDHVIPKSAKTGAHNNRVLVHFRPCNHAKADRLPTGCELIAREWVWARMEWLFGPRAWSNEPDDKLGPCQFTEDDQLKERLAEVGKELER